MPPDAMTSDATTSDARPEEPQDEPDPRREAARTARRDLVVAGVLGLVSIGYLVETLQIHLPRGGATGMGPRDYPLWLGSIMLVLSLGLAGARLVTLRRLAADGEQSDAGAGSGSAYRGLSALRGEVKPLAAFVAAAVYLYLLPVLGFLLATVPLVAILVWLSDEGRRYRGVRLLVPLLVGCIVAVATHVVFDGLLGVLLPPGLFDPSWWL